MGGILWGIVVTSCAHNLEALVETMFIVQLLSTSTTRTGERLAPSEGDFPAAILKSEETECRKAIGVLFIDVAANLESKSTVSDLGKVTTVLRRRRHKGDREW